MIQFLCTFVSYLLGSLVTLKRPCSLFLWRLPFVLVQNILQMQISIGVSEDSALIIKGRGSNTSFSGVVGGVSGVGAGAGWMSSLDDSRAAGAIECPKTDTVGPK